jgi:glycosyltransferase involved in cell wall biosynthesis
LHIWDQAGVACIFAKYQELSGHKSKVIVTNTKDKFGIYSFYHKYVEYAETAAFVSRCLIEAEKADIIHIHSRVDILFRVRKKFARSKKIILHYHGTDLRGLKKMPQLPHTSLRSDIKIFVKNLVGRTYYRITRRRRHSRAQKLADSVIVATPDLLQLAENATYLPNPIDTDHFKPYVTSEYGNEPSSGKILMINNEAIDAELVLEYCRAHGIRDNIEVYDRIKNPVTYSNMPNFLRNYNTYLDVRFINGKLVLGMSKTALESLACGLTVIDYHLDHKEGLPVEHDPRNVTSSLMSIYCK